MKSSDNIERAQQLLAQEGLESISQKLYNEIYINLPGKPNAPRRWIWELLQNAKDVITNSGLVEINLQENKLEFSHNGSPFRHENLLALLSQNSTKKHNYSDDEKQEFFDRLFGEDEITEKEAKSFLNISGRFGTGFMTTYLLSKQVSLEGIYSANGSYKNFCLSFDRAVEKDTEMKDKVRNSFSSFTDLEQENLTDNIVNNYQEGVSCDTKFIYKFDSDGKAVAEQGINDLHNAIPFVLSFVEKLSTIIVNEETQQTIYSHQTIKQYDKVTIERITKKIADIDIEENIFIAKISSKHEALTIAIPIEFLSVDRYKILFPSEETPKQFISFPLVGSEKFPLPFVINSPLFNPDDSRSHVFLNLSPDHGFNKKVNLNRALFENAIDLFTQLLDAVSKLNWENLHYLAKSDLPKDVEEDWYKDLIQKKIRKNILNAEIVVTENGNRIKPKDAMFPIYRQSKLQDFWDLCKFLCGDKIPRKEDVEIWKNIIEANTNEWLDVDFDLNLEKFLLIIQNSVSFSAFNTTYFKNETKAFEALNKIIQFTEEEDKELLNRKEKPLIIFPNQSTDSSFTEKQKLSRDVNVPIQLKDVLKTTGENWYDKLVRDEVTVFERESKLTVKLVSDKIREKIEKYFLNTLTSEEKTLLDKGLFELSGFATSINKSEIESLHKFLKQIFPESISESVKEISGAEDFDWKPFQIWAVKSILKKIASLETMDKLSLHLVNTHYPEIRDKYTREEEDLMFKVDSALNDIIEFVFKFDKHLLSEYEIIPNQLNKFCKYNNEIFNDASIPQELKNILTDFGKDCRMSLRHSGVSITLPSEPRNLKWICGQLDDIVIREQDNPELKQPIRELDKWIFKSKGSITGLDELFKTFYRKRSGIVLNTYSIEERNQFDEIQQSGMGSEIAAMIKSGTTAATIKEVAGVLQEHPELTSDRIERLLELEELSKGWDTTVDQPTDNKQIRDNFENGWKGEAFVFKKLKEKSYSVQWANKNETDNGNSIVDFEGEQHFIIDRGGKFDLVAQSSEGNNIYIQVKATTTDISKADTIAMPISTREWKFVFETTDTESFYLARVFNVNSDTPEVYFMKLKKPLEL